MVLTYICTRYIYIYIYLFIYTLYSYGSDISVHDIYTYIYIYGAGSSIRIATDYWLHGPGSNPGGDEIFRPSRRALGHTQPPGK